MTIPAGARRSDGAPGDRGGGARCAGARRGARAAAAKEAKVTDADVRLRLAPDASLLVNERLTFDYDGDFQASYREIELNFGERIGDVAVSEPGGPRTGRAAAQLGCFDPFPNRFGVAQIPGGVRIVWHHKASDEERTFDVSYRVVDAVVAYDDVLDVRGRCGARNGTSGCPS